MMEIGDYVRTKQRGFQFPQIARIKSMSKDSGYKNQHFIELDHNLLPDYEYHIYEEDIDKSNPNIIDLIELGDLVKIEFEKDDTNVFEVVAIDKNNNEIGIFNNNFEFDWAGIEQLKSIVTKEQFKSIEYKVGE